MAIAFPGAVGFGAEATGGGQDVTATIYAVSKFEENDAGNSDDGLTGSLRDALLQDATSRIINFNRGGTIELASRLTVDSSGANDYGNVTIAGESAPLIVTGKQGIPQRA